jgi:hypothetical protein
MSKKFQDIFTNPELIKWHDWRKGIATVDGCRWGIVVATKSEDFNSFALNKREFDDLRAAMRDGRVAGAVVVGATTHYAEGKYHRMYVDETDAEKLATKLKDVAPKHGRFGEFYVLDDYTFGDANVPF